jgi:hypothetical protein
VHVNKAHVWLRFSAPNVRGKQRDSSGSSARGDEHDESEERLSIFNTVTTSSARACD